MANGIQKDLGKVTAYSYAKAAGYTGTEEQFQAIFNEFTENAPGLIDRMDTAVARAEAAVTNIDATVQDAVDDAVEEATASAVATANQAVSDAQAAQTAAEGAVTQANNAVTQANAAVTAAQAAQSAAEDAAESFVLDRTLTDSGAAAPADLVGDLKESLIAVAKNNGLNMLTEVTWEIGTIDGSGNDQASTNRIRSIGFINADFAEIEFTITNGYRFSAIWYDSSKGYLRSDYWYSSDITIVPPNNTKYLRLVVSKVPEENASLAYANEITASGIYEIKKLLNPETVVSENVLNPVTVTPGKFINKTGTVGTSSAYAATDFIKVSKGDKVCATYDDARQTITLRYVTAYDINKKVVSEKGAENVGSYYEVPDGIEYVRVSGNNDRLISRYARISLNGQKIPFQTYYSGSLSSFTQKNHTDIDYFKYYPLSALPEYFINTLAYRPLGELSKGYICLVSDDGHADLATYTIPMVETKEVPCTFAVMSTSAVFSTQAGIDAVVDAVNNHGCCIAQHGQYSWTTYDEVSLNYLFDLEADFWQTIGLTPHGAVCPAHNINNLIRVVAGGRFRCVRTGYDDGLPRYTNYNNGARSNMYGLTSQSSLDGTLDTQKATLDMVKENHWLRLIHWHENELTTEKKAQLEGIIDYAKSIGLTFITMKDIPDIT